MDLSKIIYLNPEYHFKNDIDRIVMYSSKNVSEYSSIEWIGYIHPMQAMILTLFTEERTLQKNIELLSEHFKMPFPQVLNIISPYINNEHSFYTEFKSQKIRFPKNVLIDTSRLMGSKISYNFDEQEFNCKKINLTPDRMHKAPQSMLFMLTNKCVTKCKYCYADKKTKYDELTTKQILEIIDNAKKLKMSYIDIIGGEVFCKKDWNVILEKLVKNDLTPSYISTKIPITHLIVHALWQTGYRNVVQVSLDSLNETELKKMIDCPSHYVEKIKEGIGLLQEYRFKIYIDTVLTKYNSTKEDILSMYEYFKTIKKLVHWEIRVPEKSIYFPDSFAEIKSGRLELVDLCNFIKKNIIPNSPYEIYISDATLHSKFQQGKCSDTFFEGGTCGVLQNKCFLLPDGKVTICEQLYWHPQFIIGDLKKQSLESIWQSEKAQSLFHLKKDFYSKNSICQSCKTFDFCTENHRRCWVRVIKAYGEENWDFPDPECCYAPLASADMLYE